MLQIGVLFCADMLKIVQIIDKHRGKVVQRPFINFQYIYIFILRKKNFFSWWTLIKSFTESYLQKYNLLLIANCALRTRGRKFRARNAYASRHILVQSGQNRHLCHFYLFMKFHFYVRTFLNFILMHFFFQITSKVRQFSEFWWLHRKDLVNIYQKKSNLFKTLIFAPMKNNFWCENNGFLFS